MKSKMIRVLAIALLTTSMSAFALPGKSKSANETNTKTSNPDETVVIYFVDEPASDQDQAQPDENKKKSEEQQKIEQQDKEWLHDLQNIVAG